MFSARDWLAIPASVRARRLYVLVDIFLVNTRFRIYLSFQDGWWVFCWVVDSYWVSRVIKPIFSKYADERVRFFFSGLFCSVKKDVTEVYSVTIKYQSRSSRHKEESKR